MTAPSGTARKLAAVPEDEFEDMVDGWREQMTSSSDRISEKHQGRSEWHNQTPLSLRRAPGTLWWPRHVGVLT